MAEAAKNVQVMETPAAPIASDTSAIVAMIERAARDETVNIDKMRELLSMRKEIMAQEAKQKFNKAMSAAQREMRPVAADSNNPQTRSKYASYFALDNAVRNIYTEHGFGLSFDTADGAPEGHIRVVCLVSHDDGHERIYRIDMPADGKGAKGGDVMTKTHATGSGVTYGQRYLLKMIFNIATGGDDDGNAAGGQAPTITDKQADEIRKVLLETKSNAAAYLQNLRVESVSDIPASKLDEAMAMLARKRKSMEAAQ